MARESLLEIPWEISRVQVLRSTCIFSVCAPYPVTELNYSPLYQSMAGVESVTADDKSPDDFGFR